MSLLLASGFLVVGLVILVLGADRLVLGAASVARGFRIPPLVIGLTIVAFGTSMPEFTVSVYSALSGATDIAIGNVVGSNIMNILLVLGLSALIIPLAVKSSTIKWEIPLVLLSSVMVLAMGSDVLIDASGANLLTRSDGLALLGFFVIYLFYLFALMRGDKGEERQDEEVSILPWPKATFFIVLGLAALVLGGKLLVDNAVVLAQAFGLSEAVIGLTVIAVGTSLPELAASVMAAIRKEVDIAVGNVVGSNLFNVFWVLGVSSLLAPLPAASGFLVDAIVMLAATALLFFALFVGKRAHLDRWQGGFFIVLYVVYVTYLLLFQA